METSARGRAEGDSTNKSPLDGKSRTRISGREKAIFPGACCAVKRTMTAVAQLVLRRRKHAPEDRIDLVKLALQIEGAGERGGIEKFRDARIARHSFAKTAIGFPGSHGVFLHPLISLIARCARFHQIEQKLAGKY